MSVDKTRPPTFEEWAKEAKRLPKDTIVKLWWEKIEECWKLQLPADPIEANAKIEPGNIAKMRKALKDSSQAAREIIEALRLPRRINLAMNTANYITGVCARALAEPPRQCDVGTAEEQAQRFGNHCESFLTKDGSKPCTGCPCCGVVQYGRCEFAWMQKPYNESEAVQ